MSQQVIDTVLKSEEEAQEILRRASVSAREIILKSREKCETERKARIDSAKAEALAFLDDAEKQADAERLMRLGESDAQCEELAKHARAKAGRAIQFIAGRLT